MWDAIKGLLTTTWQNSKPKDAILAVLFVVLLGLTVFFSARDDQLYIANRAWWYTILLLLYCTAFLPPVVRMIRCRHKYVLYVTLWGLISLTFLLILFYLYFFALVTDPADQQRWERVLNLPPVLAGAAAAAIGWYAAHQLSARNHRTNNSFSLVMQTRCSAEFIKHAESLKAFGWKITDADAAYFPREARKNFEDAKRRSTNGTTNDADKKLLAEEYRLLGVEAAIYLLNFYEFMAYGIRAGDLDEDLLYETISPAVVLLWSATANLRQYVVNGDVLAFEHLNRLINGFDLEENGKTLKINGWERRLDQERVNKP